MGINFDPSHTFPIGDFPNISVYRLGKNIIHLHVSDNDGVTNVHWRPGMGKIDWIAMFQALKDVGYDGVVSIELEDVPGVSRGPNSNAPGVYRNVTATDEFVAETVAGMNYLKGICKDLGIPVETEPRREAGRRLPRIASASGDGHLMAMNERISSMSAPTASRSCSAPDRCCRARARASTPSTSIPTPARWRRSASPRACATRPTSPSIRPRRFLYCVNEFKEYEGEASGA